MEKNKQKKGDDDSTQVIDVIKLHEKRGKIAGYSSGILQERLKIGYGKLKYLKLFGIEQMVITDKTEEYSDTEEHQYAQALPHL